MDAGEVPPPSVTRLAAELIDGAAVDGLLPELESWLTGSPRFRAFATANAPKIRKKLRGASDAETLRDVRLELAVAHLLLSDRRVGLAWERYGSGKVGPDFTLTIPGLRSVNLELTRMRRAPEHAEAGVPWIAKLRQLPPGMPNAVVVGIGGNTATALDIAASSKLIRARADAKDEPFFAARGFAGSRDFYSRFLRLGAVLVWCEDASGSERATLWRNRSARIAVPDAIARACLTCLQRGGT
jgi:hypothetical protein